MEHREEDGSGIRMSTYFFLASIAEFVLALVSVWYGDMDGGRFLAIMGMLFVILSKEYEK